MSLSERLQRARRDRLRAAGMLDEGEADAATAPARTPEQSGPEPPSPIVIEVLPRTGPHPVVAPRPRPTPATGATPDARCPNCNHDAKVDMVDLVGHRTHMSCPNCFAMWQVATDASSPLSRPGATS